MKTTMLNWSRAMTRQVSVLCLCLMLGWTAPPPCAAGQDPPRAAPSRAPGEEEVMRILEQIEKLRSEGKNAEAIPLAEWAVMIVARMFGPTHELVGSTLIILAHIYDDMGDYVHAEPLYWKAYLIKEKVLGPDHPHVAQSLKFLGVVYRHKGDYERAEVILQRSLSIYEKAFGPDHPEIVDSLSDLGGVYFLKRDLKKAASLSRRALSIAEKVLGPDHSDLAILLNNVGAIYYENGDTVGAESLLQRSLAIREKALGPDHLSVAESLNNLATVVLERGDYVRAEPLFKRALSIETKALGPKHPKIASTLSNLAALYEIQGDYTQAVQLSSRSQDVDEYNLSLILASGSERQKAAYLSTLTYSTYATISFHLHSAPSNAQALRLSLTTILRRKGRALDVMTDQVASLRRRLNPQDSALLDRLSVVQSQLSTLALSGPGNTPPDEYLAIGIKLNAEFEQLQDSISRRSAEFKVQAEPVTIEQVQQAIPRGAALVEFFSFRPFDVKAKRPASHFGAARYVAYVLRDNEPPLWIDLGEAKHLDADVSRWLVALRCPQTVDDINDCPPVTDVNRLARGVDERVMRPVRKLLGGARQVFISPDGALNLVPFGALVDESGKYVIERYSLTYLAGGRDLLRLQLNAASKEVPLVLADPAFGNPGGTRASEAAPARRSVDLLEVNFTSLSGTAAEAKAVAAILPNARVLTQDDATEMALKQVHGPRILHVATHGFFLSDQPEEVVDGIRGLGLNVAGESIGPRMLIRSENPLLRSGLVLAKANLPPPVGSEDDGILTAFEVAGLDLSGTKLVVLSACDTGVGMVENGEGIYGLRRALVLAGSESQVMSLWQVSDTATKDLMVGYYKRLRAGEGRMEGLRQVQLEMLQGKGRSAVGVERERKVDYSHPYYWAAFIQSGDWRRINF